jgi:hypothetical protein
VIESTSAGTDTVQTSITYALSMNLENLTLTGSGNINGTGNIRDNVIVGNGGNNTLDGGSGADTIDGGNRTDVTLGGVANDTINFGTGNVWVVYLSMANALDTAANGFDTSAECQAAVQRSNVSGSTWNLQLNFDGAAGIEYTIAQVTGVSGTLDATADLIFGGT